MGCVVIHGSEIYIYVIWNNDHLLQVAKEVGQRTVCAVMHFFEIYICIFSKYIYEIYICNLK